MTNLFESCGWPILVRLTMPIPLPMPMTLPISASASVSLPLTLPLSIHISRWYGSMIPRSVTWAWLHILLILVLWSEWWAVRRCWVFVWVRREWSARVGRRNRWRIWGTNSLMGNIRLCMRWMLRVELWLGRWRVWWVLIHRLHPPSSKRRSWWFAGRGGRLRWVRHSRALNQFIVVKNF